MCLFSVKNRQFDYMNIIEKKGNTLNLKNQTNRKCILLNYCFRL